MTSRTFRAYDPEEVGLLPPSARDWLPTDHLAYVLSDLVLFQLITPRIGYPSRNQEGEDGQPCPTEGPDPR